MLACTQSHVVAMSPTWRSCYQRGGLSCVSTASQLNGRRHLLASTANLQQRSPAQAGSRYTRSVVAQADSSNFASGGLLDGEDFYSILNVTSTADARDIKRAYHAMMRDFHPDRWASAGVDTSDMCTLLNEIYETLSDEDRRAMYDALSGFSTTSVNPFLDTTFERDQVFVDEIACIGCGKCCAKCPASFEIEDSLYGRARVTSQTADTAEELQIAMEVCPVDCIHWVSLPQLSLLETALGSMPRVQVSVMQRFGRSGGNVFEAAYRAYERRQAAISARAAAAHGRTQQVQVDWSFWASAAPTPDEATHGRSAAQDPMQRRIAGLAANAARAARLWRLMNAGIRGPMRSLAESAASLDSA